ncbi:Uncharacterised protein [Aerococcus viridans]|uniref:Uncharacterized protein n=1 Tax=Aerococcus viridans (strain ATCC 11563 / DSM 20340 / CCUG 4311 / JCM 20461 / NBRC 12219 / NCTC 8251 / M1) TaxID=655812 RepID=A0ABP2I6G5_AERVM|nr:hypothetical protein HMPREF0061_1383 [Aerococcus viridans ATCC 11563 = CCUG 4311]SUU08628.1 Uncharacterised protein [Aerococcus viridans]
MDVSEVIQYTEIFFLYYLFFYVTYISVGNIFAMVKIHRNRQRRLMMNQLDH